MKKIFIYFTALFVSVLSAQHYTLSETPFSRYLEAYRTDDFNAENVEGLPFLFDKNLTAEVISEDGKNYIFSEANYQIKSDIFLYKVENDYFEIFPDKVKFIRVKDGEQYRTFIPGTKLAVLGDEKAKFYEVFTENPNLVFVLVSYKKILKPKNASQTYASDKTFHEYVYTTKKQFFVKGPHGFVKVVPKVKNIVDVLGEDRNMLKTLKKFVRQNQLKISNPTDLQKLMEFYYLRAREL